MNRFALGMLAAASCVSAAVAETTIEVHYAFPNNFKELQERLVAEFRVRRPDITVKFWNPAANYEEGTAQVLRNAIVGQMPDVYYNGLNQIRVLVEQGHAVALDKFVTSTGEWSRLGYVPALMSLGALDRKTYGLPFAISVPIIYVNENLLKAAGGSVDTFPRDWDGILDLGQKMTNRAENIIGFLFAHDASGNWLYQALAKSMGGSLASPDGCKVAFDSPAGRWGLGILEKFHKRGMPDLGYAQGRQAFAAGRIGIYVESSSAVTLMERNVADRFVMRTLPFPVPSKEGRLPSGGVVAMILAKDAKKQEAAWEYVKFVTGPTGQTLMARHTGYAPGNQKALDDPQLLKGYYEARPNHATGVNLLPISTGWDNWSGPNSVKIVSIIQEYMNDVVTGRKTADTAMPMMIRDVQKLLPSCKS
jgi:multiple sugar transport system substrate-binding protein